MTFITNPSPVARFVHSTGWPVRWRKRAAPQCGSKPETAVYQLTDRLHGERTVQVSAEEIVGTVSAWLSELGTKSPLVDDFARAVRVADWPKMHALGEYLAVDVTALA